MSEDSEVRSAVTLIHLATLRHLHDYMVQHGIEDVTEAGDDEWILSKLAKYSCFSRDDVRERYNELAKSSGQEDKLIP